MLGNLAAGVVVGALLTVSVRALFNAGGTPAAVN